MLTPAQFLAQLRDRRKTQSLDAIGRELGVSRQAVHQWLRGQSTPSPTVLLLAEIVWRDQGYTELSPGSLQ